MNHRLCVFLMLAISGLNLEAQTITDGLIGYWPFNGNAYDESSNSNHGQVYGARLTRDRFGVNNSAYDFDGNGDYIDCGNHSSLFVSTNTTNFWFKYADTSSIQTLVNDANSLSGEWGASYNFHPGADGLQAVLGGGSNDAWVAARVGKTYADNKWHMFTSVYSADDNTFMVYIDGCYITGKTHERYGFTLGKDSLRHNGTDHWIFGAHSQYFSSTNNAGPRYYNGLLDDVALYNRVLTSCEIHELYTREVFTDTIYQYISVHDTITDTTHVTLYDTATITVYDTTFLTHVDTTFQTVFDTLYTSVADTLLIRVYKEDSSGSSCDIRLYPNPTDNMLHIDSRNGCDLSNYSLSIFNDIGQTVYTTAIPNAVFEFSLERFANGFYVVEIRDKGNRTIQRKIIVLY